jgi:hypothetical protein
MKRTLMAVGCLLALGAAEPPSLETLIQRARAAREAGDHPAYLKNVEAMVAMLPWQPAARYSLARAYALNGRGAEAIGVLDDLAAAGWGFDAAGDAVLASLRGDPAFKVAAARLAANAKPQGHAEPLRKLPLAGKQPEGIVATADGTLYIGTLRDGIYRIEADGLRELYRPGAGWGVVGLRVDAARGEMIACVTDEAVGKGRVVRLALPDLKPRATVDLKAERVLCNDSAVLPDGRLAVTDSTGGRLWLVDHSAAAPMKLDRSLIYPNGVAFGGGSLYVAHVGGLLTVDLATGVTRDVKADDTALIGIDGLTWHEGKLLAVQNGTQPIRILRITPPADADADAKVEVLAAGHAMLSGATTATPTGGKLVVVTQTGIPNGSLPDDPMLVTVPLDS